MSEYTMKLPDVGEGVAEAEIVEWYVAVGESITEDDTVADVMSDKATVELPSPVSGVVQWIAGEVGDVIAVGSPFVRIAMDVASDADGSGPSGDATDRKSVESVRVPDDSHPNSGVEPETGRVAGLVPATDRALAPPRPGSAPRSPDDDPDATESVRSNATATTAAPAVRARARDLGIDLGEVGGSGPEGRVLHRDLDALLRSSKPSADTARSDRPARSSADSGRTEPVDEVEDIAVIGLRRNIAARMELSARRIPHFTYVEEVDVTALELLRHALNTRHSAQPDQDRPANAGRTKLSLLPFLMRAMVVAIRDHPEMNARFDDDEGIVHRHRAVHLGVATQTDRGLMVPVVANAEQLDVWATASEVERLAGAARNTTIALGELNGSTITITSLGALGGIVSTPIINAPEVAIVGVNKIVERVVVIDGAFTSRKMMNLSSSFDHRVVDGADAAAFIQSIKGLLESPAQMFIDP